MQLIIARTLLTLVTLIVAGYTAAASYSHIADLATAHGQTGWKGTYYPLAVDGIALAGSLSLAVQWGPKRLAQTMLGIGVLTSIGANIAVAPAYPLAQLISALPSVGMLLTVELLIRGIERRTPAAAAEDEATDEVAEAVTAAATASNGRAERRTKLMLFRGSGHSKAATRSGTTATPAASDPAEPLAAHRSNDDETATPAATPGAESIASEPPKHTGRRAATRATTRQKPSKPSTRRGANELTAAIAFLAHNPEANGKDVAEALGVPERSGRRYRTKALNAMAANGSGSAATTTAIEDVAELADTVDTAATEQADDELGHNLMDHLNDMAVVR